MKWIFLPLFGLLYHITQAQPRPADYRAAFQQDSALHRWARSIPGFNPDVFAFRNTTGFGEVWRDTLRGKEAATYFNAFGTLVSYSPDKKQWLDFFSYQVSMEPVADGRYRASYEADQSLLLGSSAGNTRTGIAYMGASSWIEETFWVDNHTFLAVGVTNAKGFHPFICIGDTDTRKIHHYSPPDDSHNRSRKYVSFRWAKMASRIIRE
ncbi:hypothetical protein HF329_10350 [Chitinophaga oryzae]|uniref:Uncharacterized protein n=1 Tax=Chitinophaga oryzae TaxID=2725414 RepID=A0AAE6ZFF2_9BACT|nr:hypothetical protein [Chitinophaga oryzae]QJB31691.1 hypothetical protein HF329_10350 [Chitinophaga oryzae]